MCSAGRAKLFATTKRTRRESQGSLASPPLCGMRKEKDVFTRSYLQEPGLPQTISVQARHRTHPPRKEAGRTSSQWFFQKPALAGELRAAGGRTQQEKLFFSPAHTERHAGWGLLACPCCTHSDTSACAHSPLSARRCVSQKARSNCSSCGLRGSCIARCMRRASSHCSNRLKEGLERKSRRT